MGGSTQPPVMIASLYDWRAAGRIWGNEAYEPDALAQFSNSNHLGPVRWHQSGDRFHGSFSWCPGQEVTWNYDTQTQQITVDNKSQVCSLDEPNRIPDSTCYEFLCYVFSQEPSLLVEELSSSPIHDFRVFSEGSSYFVVFTYASPVLYTTASAIHDGSGFGPITVT